jgi:hypothetical protein
MASAINWTYYYLGRYRGHEAMPDRGGYMNPRNALTLVTEISSDEAGRQIKRPLSLHIEGG